MRPGYRQPRATAREPVRFVPAAAGMNDEPDILREAAADAPGAGVPDAAQAPVSRLQRWIGRHVPSLPAALAVYLALGFLALLAGLLAFGAIAAEVREGDTQAADEAVLRWVHARSTPFLNEVAVEITALGGSATVVMVVLVASVFLWVAEHRWSVLLLWVAMLGETVLSIALKAAFARPRPDVFPWQVENVKLASFPSGHAMTAAVVYLTVAYLVMRLEARRALRTVTLTAAVLLVVVIGLSRIYLGVHYPSDVVAGWVAGFAWATFCTLGIEMLRVRRGARRVT
jgi:undecaprenyl-diphosphatase